MEIKQTLFISFLFLAGCTGPDHNEIALSLEHSSFFVFIISYIYVNLFLNRKLKQFVSKYEIILSCTISIFLSIHATYKTIKFTDILLEEKFIYIFHRNLNGIVLSIPFMLITPLFLYTVFPENGKKHNLFVTMILYFFSILFIYVQDGLGIIVAPVILPWSFFFISIPVFIFLLINYRKNEKK